MNTDSMIVKNRSYWVPRMAWQKITLFGLVLFAFSISNQTVLNAQQEVAEPQIHFLLVMDLTDPDIGVKKDLEHWEAEIKRVELNLQVTPKVHKITDRDPGRILKACEDLKVNSNDTILFFYGGHGFNKNRSDGEKDPSSLAKGKKWPEMVVYETVGDYKKRRGLPIWKVFKKLKAKNPRLLIALADCCNEYITPLDAPPTFSRGIDIERYYRILYLQSVGAYLASGAKLGQYARGNKKRGGYFTDKVFKELHRVTSYDASRKADWKPTWDEVFRETAKKAIFKDNGEGKGDQFAQWEKVQGPIR